MKHGKPLDSMGLLQRGAMRKAVWREPNQDDATEFLDMLKRTDQTALIRAAEHLAYYLDVTIEKATQFFINWNKAQA